MMVTITLLCLGDGTGSGAGLLELVAAASTGVASFRVATHPSELPGTAGYDGVTEVLVIDGLAHPACDVPGLIAALRARRNPAIMVAVSSHRQRLSALRAGADIAFRLPAHPAAFKADVHELATYYQASRRPSPDASTRPVMSPATTRIVPVEAARTDCAEARSPPRQRVRAPPQAALPVSPPWQLITGRRVLRSPDGREVPLTYQEHDFLGALFRSGRRHLSLQDWCRGPGRWSAGNEPRRTLAAIVCRMRRKCARAGLALPIEAERGNGYVFRDERAVVQDLPPHEAQRSGSESGSTDAGAGDAAVGIS